MNMMFDLLKFLFKSLELKLSVTVRLECRKRFAHTAAGKRGQSDIVLRIVVEDEAAANRGEFLFRGGRFASGKHKSALVFGRFLVSART